MTIAIHTKYIGPTNIKGSRIKVSARMGNGKLITKSYGYGYDGDEHRIAATQFVQDNWPDKIGSMLFAGNSIDGCGDIYTLDASCAI